MISGPADPLRPIASVDLLPAAREAAARAGVTRLADLTGLDCLAFPVWQAVRPMGLALSVHQGKGMFHADAMLGALLEAWESDCAERFDGPGPTCRFDALAPAERAASLDDHARDRANPPSAGEAHRWAVGWNLHSGQPFHIPFWSVSLDFTRGLPSPFDRASNGVSAGISRDLALASGLSELIERDAVAAWWQRGLVARTADNLRLESIPFDWFALLRERISRRDRAMRVYRLPAITGAPCFVCEINDSGKDAAPFRATWGSACHASAESGLFQAVAEAIQARATFISGARDDMFPSDYALTPSTPPFAFALPRPPGMRGVEWDDIPDVDSGFEPIIAALADAGYPQAAAIILGEATGFIVVRTFVAGLGALARSRRDPI